MGTKSRLCFLSKNLLFHFRALETQGHVVKHRTPSTASAPHLMNAGIIVPENISETDEDDESEDTASLGKGFMYVR